MKLVVLAGGKGTRLGLTDRPKPMATIAGKTLLERIVEGGRDAGLTDMLFLNGHLAGVIEDYFGDGSRFGVRITHVREAAPVGTAGAVRDARHLLTEPFVLAYGDTLMDVDLAHLARTHLARGGIGTLFVHPNDHPHDSDLVEADEEGRIRRFLAKPHAPDALLPNLANAALYALDPEAIDYVATKGPADWARDTFPTICERSARPLIAYRSIEYIKDMGTPERLAAGEAAVAGGRLTKLSRRRPKPALFLDRDGVINVEINGVHRPEDLVLEAGAGAAIRRANKAGVPVICITNQPDVAKGFMDRPTLATVFAALDTRLGAEGAHLDDLYYCPHHPERGWPGEVAELKIDCDCRKPKPGMLLSAARDHNIDLARSWFVGDRLTDVSAAHAAGAKSILLRGPTVTSGDAAVKAADLVADRLSDAVDLVLERLA